MSHARIWAQFADSHHDPQGALVFSSAFWRDTAERAIATFAQSALALLGADGFDLLEVDVADVFGVSLGGAVLSVLKALVASKIHDPESASLVDLPGKHAADR